MITTKPHKILHLSDIHVFRNKRHQEHLQVFANVVKIIKEKKIDLIFLGGDIVDSKARLSPEQINVASEMFKMFASCVPIVMIPGNHDTDLRQKGALDSLTPILNNIETVHPIYYLKESGVYNIYNIDWAVWSCIDELNPFDINPKTELSQYTIGCFHGPIQGVSTESGFTAFPNAPAIELFKDCDVVMLGDIHKTSFHRNQIKEIEIEEEDLQKYLEDGWELVD